MQKINFNDRYGLTRAVIDGHKTQTRHIATFEEIKTPQASWQIEDSQTARLLFYDGERLVAKSRYCIGEVVAIAQTYDDVYMSNVKESYRLQAYFHNGEPGWFNKMFVKADLMPYRIKVIDIRVEKLQDISYEDCLKEGVIKGRFRDFPNVMFYPYKDCKDSEVSWTPDFAFSELIDKVSGKGTWDRNPWVFVYTYVLVK